jgi:hypothetical protein
MNHQPKQTLLYITILIILTLLGFYLAATNLANYTPITGDDAWIMSASFKLASEGIFGSDPYTGFFNADQHYFIALPVYHFLQAASFKLMGFGVAQARLPNLFSAILLIWLTAALANRHHGRKTALLAVLLLILLCPNPLSIEDGARKGRRRRTRCSGFRASSSPPCTSRASTSCGVPSAGSSPGRNRRGSHRSSSTYSPSAARSTTSD